MSGSDRATDAVWAGEEHLLLTGATVVPVSLGVAHGYPDVDAWQAVALGHAPGYIYARNTNPTVEAFEQKIRVLEGADDATAFSTGMAAISNTLFALLEPGSRVVSVKDTYGGTSQLFLDTLPRWGVEVALCETADADALEAEIGKGCALLYLETPTNPTLKVTPICETGRRRASGRRRRRGGQYGRHADEPEPAGARCGSGRPQRHEVSGWACRRHGRGVVRPAGSGAPGLPPPRDQRREPRPDERVLCCCGA